MVLSAEYILDSLLIPRIIPKSKQASFFVCLQFINYLFNNRVLLATIRDKGLCPCPRCLMPKLQFDQTGTKLDSNFRIKNVRIYLSSYVQIARDAIYKSAAAIAGVVVNRALKATSSVPTLVCQLDLLAYNYLLMLLLFYRMRSLIDLVLTLTSPVCLWSIFCTSSNWASGKPFSLT